MVMVSITCKKTDYTLGSITAPSNLSLAVSEEGYDSVSSKGGDGKGVVTITISGNNALAYKVDFGDSSANSVKIITGNSYTYTYRNNGSFNYIITLNAIGTGGAISTISKSVYINVSYQLDATTIEELTGNSSKVWIIDRNTSGHVGVGPTSTFTPDYYTANPNERSACLYDDEVTFQQGTGSNIFVTLDNKGESFVINAATAFYGQGTNAGDNCYTIDPGGKKQLQFQDATSASTSDISTRKQFTVPGNGLVAFGTGGTAYEILTLTDSIMQLRNIGADGLAWYQKFKKK